MLMGGERKMRLLVVAALAAGRNSIFWEATAWILGEDRQSG